MKVKELQLSSPRCGGTLKSGHPCASNGRFVKTNINAAYVNG